ncbi:Ribosomal protein L22 bacterial/chloroplast-type [Penicillium riverlandense]|uniref:mitochondrial 54S ribosomal protein L22 n=1 Tax=Penicillium riverlandense TaxID=1903569 RepID=UPI00254814FF|nr:mitochondrial 54S ribosomal protein L22 [Penicillium riverlandense]KAJ5820010.1 Ribosomal protein L22 bacterial/chloroplast-type [Penicillium riverlandense]
MGSVSPYGLLVRSARTGVSFVPRRTLASTAIRRAQDDSNNKKGGFLSSMKNLFLGGDKQDHTVINTQQAPTREKGGLGADSIFAQEMNKTSGATPTRQKKEAQELGQEEKKYLESRQLSNLQAALNPVPKSMRRWQTKMVVREIRKRGRVPRVVQIKRTEREELVKSHWFKTSVKKLGPLARQIAGKNIDEAILQMRFSKKKAAKDVLEHLEHAKNVAVVRSGMGLGVAQESEPFQPTTVTLPDGTKKKITDPTSIYIEQAWVNRGPYGEQMEHRARGRINRLRPPATGISVLLKEEKTRIREWQDREATALRQRKEQLWTQLPDRKISAQNQYYSW